MRRAAIAGAVIGLAAAVFGCGLIVDPIADLTKGSDDAGAVRTEGGATDAAPTDTGGLDASAGCDADLQSDDKNCGACGHDCLGAQCTGGLCGSLFVAGGGVRAIDVKDGVVYTADTSDGIQAIDSMGIVTKLRSDMGETIAVTKTHVFYGNSGGVFRVQLDGGAPAQVAQVHAVSMARNASWVYWVTDSGGNDVWRAPADGSGLGAKWGGPLPGPSGGVAATDAWVAAECDLADGLVQRDVTSGMSVSSSVPQAAIGSQIAASSALGVFFTLTPAGMNAQHLARADMGGTKVSVLFPTANEIIKIAGDASMVVFGFNGAYALGACFDPMCTGGAKQLGSDKVLSVLGIALDAKYVYYADSKPNIRKIAR